MRAHQIMTRQVITVTEDSSIVDAARIMLANHISGLPVVDPTGRVVGIVSQGDFLHRVEIGTQRKRGRWLAFFAGPVGAAADFVREHGRKVKEIMTPDPATVNENARLEDVVQVMDVKNVNRLPVMRGDELVGIVTRSNLLQSVAGLARGVPDPTADDDNIRSRIIASIQKADWAPFGLSVIVRNGIVEIGGTATSEQSRDAAIVAAENVAGVTKVHDHFCWVDLASGMYVNFNQDENPSRPI